LRKSLSALTIWMFLIPSIAILLTSVQVEGQSATTIETQLFSHSIFVPYKQVGAPFIHLDGGTNVRIVYNSSQLIDFFCQNSWEFNYSNSTSNGWADVAAHFSNQTAVLDMTYTIPTDGMWYFAFVNYNQAAGIDVFNVTLYRIDTYEIRIESAKATYSMAEQAILTASAAKNGVPLAGLSVTVGVLDPNGTTILGQTNVTNALGQVRITLDLPGLQGQYNVTVRATVLTRTVEDSATFTVARDNTPPFTVDDYDRKWHTADFAVILIATDNESGVAETCYRINNGTVQNANVDGQPEIMTEGNNNTLEYWSLDYSGNDEAPHKMLTDIKLDKTPPAGLILINGNASCANSTQATLTLLANDSISGVAQMRFRNDNLTWTPYETYGSSRDWTLETNEGTRDVYVQFRNNAGLASTAYSASIILDTVPPTIIDISRTPNGNVQPSQSVTITVNASDATSGTKSVSLTYNVNSSLAWFDFPMTLNQTTHVYEYVMGGQQASMHVEYRITAYDNAGNQITHSNDEQYTVIPEFQTGAVTIAIALSTSMVFIVRRKKYK